MSKSIYVLPFVGILWMGCVLFMANIYLNVKSDYQHAKCERETARRFDIAFYQDQCMNVENKAKYGLWADCIKREHSLHDEVWLLASIDVLSKYGYCFGSSCQQLILQNSYLVILAFCGFILLAICLSICGCFIMKFGINKLREPIIPTMHEHVPDFDPAKNSTIDLASLYNSIPGMNNKKITWHKTSKSHSD
jgi:hypothetical protein